LLKNLTAARYIAIARTSEISSLAWATPAECLPRPKRSVLILKLIHAGLGITLRTAMGLPKQLTVMEPKSSLPRLPMIDLFLHDGGRELSQAVSRFKEILLETLAENLPRKACHRA
jgi:hypothetical protein